MPRPNVTRRYFFQECALGVGKIALASLVADGAMGRLAAAGSGQMSGLPHHPPKAKAVIHLFMAGAPSQLELFDYKPELAKLEGKPLPPSIINGQRYAFIRPDAAVLGPRYKFARHGRSGAELSEMIPHIASIADDIAIVKSCRTTQFNHAPAQIYMNTGFSQPGRPSMGSWITYGLGSEAKDLPSFVVMSTGAGISGGAACWGSGFLPSSYAGTRFRNTGDSILNTGTPAGIDPATQKDTIGLINAMNDRRLRLDGDSEIATRI
ncbi:MAG: DUF1501 domain-containing protein, partial [Verrucomicrobiota bacterium]